MRKWLSDRLYSLSWRIRSLAERIDPYSRPIRLGALTEIDEQILRCFSSVPEEGDA